MMLLNLSNLGANFDPVLVDGFVKSSMLYFKVGLL